MYLWQITVLPIPLAHDPSVGGANIHMDPFPIMNDLETLPTLPHSLTPRLLLLRRETSRSRGRTARRTIRLTFHTDDQITPQHPHRARSGLDPGTLINSNDLDAHSRGPKRRTRGGRRLGGRGRGLAVRSPTGEGDGGTDPPRSRRRASRWDIEIRIRKPSVRRRRTTRALPPLPNRRQALIQHPYLIGHGPITPEGIGLGDRGAGGGLGARFGFGFEFLEEWKSDGAGLRGAGDAGGRGCGGGLAEESAHAHAGFDVGHGLPGTSPYQGGGGIRARGV